MAGAVEMFVCGRPGVIFAHLPCSTLRLQFSFSFLHLFALLPD